MPSVTYIREADESWRAGMRTWAEMLADLDLFTGELAGLEGDAFIGRLCDLGCHRRALGRIEAP